MTIAKNRFWFSHQGELIIPAAIILIAFIGGLVAGALVIHRLSPDAINQLQNFVNSYLKSAASIKEGHASYQDWLGILKTESTTLIICWFLGLTVVGIPLIIALIGGRGFIIGFTVGFMVKEKAARGLLLALAAVLPQNLFYLPALLIAGVLSSYFSLSLIRGNREHPVASGLVVYTLVFLLISLVLLAGTWIEAYLSPSLVRLVVALL